MRNLSKSLILTLAFLLTILISVNAQPGDPGENPDAAPVPITGIEILLLLGGALGLKKILDVRKFKK